MLRTSSRLLSRCHMVALIVLVVAIIVVSVPPEFRTSSSNSYFVNAVDTRTRHTRDDVTGHVGSTHEELLSSRAQKRDVFQERLLEMKRRMELHNNGSSLLTEGEYNKLQKKIDAYEHKVDYLDTHTDLRHLDRLLAREELMNEMHRARLSRSADEL